MSLHSILSQSRYSWGKTWLSFERTRAANVSPFDVEVL